jgi:arsenite methyltransferase
MSWSDEIKHRIRRRYTRCVEQWGFPPDAARRMLDAGYPPAVVQCLPDELLGAYSGCGFPAPEAALHGVRVAIDLGCGVGLDAWWLAAELPGDGLVIAVDMTGAMLRPLSRLRAARRLGAASICPLVADLEHLPLASAVAELVIANASLNLAVDKQLAFREAYRILKPGGALAARDLIRDGNLPAEVLQDPLADATSLGGAVSEAALRSALSAAGFTKIRISDERPFGCLTSVKVDAVKP